MDTWFYYISNGLVTFLLVIEGCDLLPLPVVTVLCKITRDGFAGYCFIAVVSTNNIRTTRIIRVNFSVIILWCILLLLFLELFDLDEIQLYVQYLRSALVDIGLP